MAISPAFSGDIEQDWVPFEIAGWVEYIRADLAQPPLIDACRSFLRYYGTDQAKSDAAIAAMREAVGAIVDADQHPMDEPSLQQATQKLTKYQPCGCVICTCEDDHQCHGCGAKNCGTHPVGVLPQAVYEPSPQGAPIDEPVCGKNYEAGLWSRRNLEAYLEDQRAASQDAPIDERPKYCSVCGQLASGPVLCCNEGRGLPMVTKTEARALLAGKESK